MLAPSFGERKRFPVANVLPMETRIRIVGALVEGNSIRATSRLTGVDKNAVMALALRVGEGCAHLHSKLVRGLAAYVVQCDETWSFIAKKEARCDPSKDPAEWGDVYSFLAIDSTSKIVISFHVGKRDQASTDAFISDLRARLRVVPHLTTDGWKPYVSAVGESFAGCADFGQVVKRYSQGSSRGPDHRYEPPRDPFIIKTRIAGAPDPDKMSTSHVERLNLTLRHTVGRTRRLCLAFSKTLRGHDAAMALGVMAYNFTRLHLAVGGDRTPAMAAGLTDHVWTIGELLTAALDAESVEDPEPVKLALAPWHVSPVRELPNGRGFLRVVGGGASTAASTATQNPPAPAPVAASAVAASPVASVEVSIVASASADPAGQLDLFAWRPKSRPMGQLNLFGDPVEGA
jgi:IS1 family transposase